MSTVQYFQFDNEEEALEFASERWADESLGVFITQTEKGWQVLVKQYPAGE